MQRLVLLGLVLAGLASVALAPDLARACASCGAGDPTLQIVGTEQPFAGRVRLAAVVQHSSYSDDEATVYDQRVLLGTSLAVSDIAMLALAVPLAWREVSYRTLAHDTTLGLGDADFRLRVTVLRDRPFAPAHRLVLELGVRMPTAPLLTDGERALPLPAQLGTGAFEPLVGLTWLSIVDDTSLWLSVQGAFPTTGFEGWRNGAALRASAAVQWQPARELGLRLASDLRLEGPSGRAQDAVGDPVAVLFVGGGVVVAPSPDLVLHLLVRVPVFQASDPAHAAHTEGVMVEGGLALDV